jgi:hypothetical protein
MVCLLPRPNLVAKTRSLSLSQQGDFWPLVLIGIAAASVAGCFDPQVAEGGFSCNPNQMPACPEGFSCVNSRCISHPGVGMNGAYADGPSPDFSQGLPQEQADLGQSPQLVLDLSPMPSPPDLSQAAPPPDLSPLPPPPDLSQPPPNICVHSPCVVGARLDANCDPCVREVCLADSYCCNIAWDSSCVIEAGIGFLGVCAVPVCL